MLRDRFYAAATFPEFLGAAVANAALWAAIARRARAPEALVERVRALPARWRLLVLLEDWCGDAVNTLPALAALAEGAQLPAAERYAAARRWYARDRGETTLREVVGLLEEASACVSC